MRELGLSRSSTATSETYDTRPRKIGASAAEAQQLSNWGCKVAGRGRKPKRLAEWSRQAAEGRPRSSCGKSFDKERFGTNRNWQVADRPIPLF